MKFYSVDTTETTRDILAILSSGVARVGIDPGHVMHTGCASCFVEATDGTIVQISAFGHDLEYRFEVFPIQAQLVPPSTSLALFPYELTAPVTATLFQTDEWLDPLVPTGPTIGQDPIMQCQGLPGSAPQSATKACRYIGGIELSGGNGNTLFLATASFPYTLHVQGLAEDARFDRRAYEPLS